MAEGLPIEFKVADAEALPFAEESFDTVVSTFGVMFTPNQEQAAAELLRVCKSGGQIGLANWTPDGFIGQLFKTLGKYLPPPPAAIPDALGHAQAPQRTVRAWCDLDQDRATRVQISLPLGAALH
jgi:SAM-dependent methyltransferase